MHETENIETLEFAMVEGFVQSDETLRSMLQ